MRTTAAKTQIRAERVAVAVGILQRTSFEDGVPQLLVQQRKVGTPCAGQWEFPGGKIESGEGAEQALRRELKEELGIVVTATQPLITLPVDYAHARVKLEVFVVSAFRGQVRNCEGQPLRWARVAEIRKMDTLAAVPPLLDALVNRAPEKCNV